MLTLTYIVTFLVQTQHYFMMLIINSLLQVEKHLVTDFNYVAGISSVLTNQLKEVIHVGMPIM